MRSASILVAAAATLATAQDITSIVLTNGVTTTITLPVFPEPTPSVTVTATVAETTLTVTPGASSSAADATPDPSTTVTVSVGTSTVESGVTTTTIAVPPVPFPSLSSVSDPVVTLPTFTAPINSTLLTSTATQTYYTSAPNATTSGPVTVPTAAADKVALKGSAAGLLAFGVAGLFLL
ncbi:hypothetical protein CKAH01_03109 [Colletotrichum kahawae]|uniref:Uncharacterized protein n=1 Tax=Colletotrichum kahawae TaxID=34407 RepID=A0AAE0DD67_COLKA|nr:hypothetical protein CKAH01_03109 [Colletotrichum kahawae]